MRNAPEKSEAFLRWGDSKKVRFVLRGRTLRFIFSERFVLRIIQDGGLLDTIAVFKHLLSPKFIRIILLTVGALHSRWTILCRF